MRKVSVLAWGFALLIAASASAAHFDMIPAGTISVNGVAGSPTGNLLTGNLGWADAAVGSKTFDMNQIKMAKVEGEYTELTGHRGTIDGNWKGTWGTLGLTDYDWITGKYVSNPTGITSPNSYVVGWIQNSCMVWYAADKDTYANAGVQVTLEDTRADSIGGDGYETVDDAGGSTKVFADAAFQFKMEWDLTAYDPDNKAAGGGLMYMDYNDPATGNGWYSDQTGGTFPADGQAIGVNHGDWDPSEPDYYDTYSQTVLTIALVEDNVGGSGSVTYGDITLDVVGRVAGDVNLDGYVTQADLDLANDNLGSNDAHWGMGDVTGGGVDDWGGLDGVVDVQDIALITAALGGGVPGDLNLHGSVTSGDLDLVRANWGRNDASGTLEGDADGDGFVGSSDLDIVRANWGNTAAAAVIPEPGFLMLVAAGLAALALRRK